MAELLSAALPVECSRASLNGATLDVEAGETADCRQGTMMWDSDT